MKASVHLLLIFLALGGVAIADTKTGPLHPQTEATQPQNGAATADGESAAAEGQVKTIGRDATLTPEEAKKKKFDEAVAASTALMEALDKDPKDSLEKIEAIPELRRAIKKADKETLARLVGSSEAAERMANIYAYQKDFEKFYGSHLADIKAGKIPKGTEKFMAANPEKHAVAAREISERTGEKPELVAFRLQRIQNLIDQSKSADAGKAMSSLMSTLRDRQELSATLKSKAGDYSLTPYFERATAKELVLHDAKKKDAAALRAAASKDDAFTQAFGEHWQKEALPRMKRFNDWVRDGKPDDKEMIAEFGKPESWGTWAVGARNTPALMRAATGAEGADGLRTLSASYFTGSGDKRSFTFKNEAELADFMNHVNSTFEKAKLESKDKTVQFSAVVKTQLDAMPKPEIPLTATIPLSATAMANAIASGFARGLKPPPVRMAAVMGKSDADYGGAGESHCEGGFCTSNPTPKVAPVGGGLGGTITNRAAATGAYSQQIDAAVKAKDYAAIFRNGPFYRGNPDRIEQLIREQGAENLANEYLNATSGPYLHCPSCWLGNKR